MWVAGSRHSSQFLRIRLVRALVFLLALCPVLLVAREEALASSGKINLTSQTSIIPKTGVIDLTGVPATRSFSIPGKLAPADSYGGDGIDFYGAIHVSFGGGIANITIDGIRNSSSTYTSGSLRLDLWALQAPYYGGSFTGYQTASVRTSQVTGLADQIAPGQSFYNIVLQLPYTPPGDSSYNSYVMVLEEYSTDTSRCGTSDHYCIISALNLQTTPSGSAPVCAPSANPGSLAAGGGTVTVSANCSNSPTSYSWTINGTYATANSSFGYSIPANTSSSPKTYTFSVSASNGYGTGSGSAAVSVAGTSPPPPSNHVNAPAPDSSPCVRSATTACLLNGRFRVQANWSPAQSASASPTSLTYFSNSRAETDNAAVLYFQSPSFFEIGVTLYNGCAYGGTPYTWVFIGGLTDWSWGMTITDTLHGNSKQYYNSYGAVTQTTTDYTAFSCN